MQNLGIQSDKNSSGISNLSWLSNLSVARTEDEKTESYEDSYQDFCDIFENEANGNQI